MHVCTYARSRKERPKPESIRTRCPLYFIHRGPKLFQMSKFEGRVPYTAQYVSGLRFDNSKLFLKAASP